jgi:hypothetical protein
MTNRREFLHLGVAALSLPIAARAGMSSGIFAAGESAGAEPLYKVFFDQRFPASVAFAGEMERRSMPTHAIRGDITDVWFNDLYYRWKQGPAAIAGLTAPGPIFCLEMLARDAGMRVAFRADHRSSTRGLASNGQVEHEISGPENVVEQAADSLSSAADWPARTADIVARFPAERGRATKTTVVGQAVRCGNDPEHLVTWVIAPLRRA